MPTKVCSKCHVEKGLGEFYKAPRYKFGVTAWCKVCTAKYIRDRRHSGVYQDQERARERSRKRDQSGRILLRRKIPQGVYAALRAKQGGRCAICQAKPTKLGLRGLHVDHDHKTGKIRGLLCRECNLALGIMKDSVERLQRAILYLTCPAATRPYPLPSDLTSLPNGVGRAGS